MTETSGLQIRKVSFSYTPRNHKDSSALVLREITLQVLVGQICVLLGSSGCGKSTLLQVIAGLLTPSSGSVYWGDEDLATVAVHRRGFTLLFQDGQLFPHRDVAGNVAYGLEMKRPRWKRTDISHRVREMLQLVHLEDYGDRTIDTLSGGQAGRVALARALAPQPRLLLLDEPLSALDQDLRYELATEIRQICQKTGTAALYVTHDQQEATLVGDKIVKMCNGRISDAD